MRYRVSLTIPAGTTKVLPVQEKGMIVPGIVTELAILFPAGHGGLTRLQIYHGEHLIYPTTPDTWFLGDDIYIVIADRYKILSEPYALTFRGWAESSALEHTIYVDVTMEIMIAAFVPSDISISLPKGFI